MSPSRLQGLLKEVLAFHKAGRLDDAEKIYRQLRVGAPRNFDVFHLSGLLAYQQGRSAEAVDFLAQALKLDRKAVVCEMRLGMAKLAVGRTAEAETHLRHVVEAKPDFYEGWDRLAYCLKTQDRLDEALPCHGKAVALKPDFAMGWYNFGLTFVLLGRIPEALPCHERALAADPAYHLAHFGQAQALHQLHRIPEAIEAYDRFLALQPGNHEARSNRLLALHSLEAIPREQLFAEHVAFGQAVGSFPAPSFLNSPDPARRLRLAILSPDLRTHSCAYFLEPLLRHLAPSQFEVYLYHDHFREDEVSARLRAGAAMWRNFVGQTAAAVEKVIRADAPDILVDLAGHTGLGGRLPIFARRLAPVQVTYLGYPNTTGLPAMDYRFTDSLADPGGDADPFATEHLVRFAPTAWTYAPLLTAPAVSGLPCAASNPFTFGCFNNASKFTEAMLRLWGRVLQAVPDSRLALKGRGLGDDASRIRFLERLTLAGVPAGRVLLLERTADTESHLAQYHEVDIALDTFPYHGTTTTCEALWMGVPVISLAGDRHMSRVGASLLHAVGHPGWIAGTEEGYINLAVTLAADRAGLAVTRARLREEMRASALLDHEGQSRRFAGALRRCWQSWAESREVKMAAESRKVSLPAGHAATAA